MSKQILVDDFESPRALTEYMAALASNDTLYYKKHQQASWKRRNEISQELKMFCFTGPTFNPAGVSCWKIYTRTSRSADWVLAS